MSLFQNGGGLPILSIGPVGVDHRSFTLFARAAVPRRRLGDPAGPLEQGFTREQVALRWALGPYFSNLRHGRPAEPEAFVIDTLGERSEVEGMHGVLTTMYEVDAAWAREFPNGPDWRDVSDQYGLPGFLGTMDLNRARDEHLVACVAEMVDAGERVFVICGSSHAVKIEPALRKIVK